jgi:putative ABC transport system substrate-binding protein
VNSPRIGRRTFVRDLALLGLALPLLVSCAQQTKPARVPRIGFLTGAGNAPVVDAFKDELHQLGYIEGKNILIEWRLARPNTADSSIYATELAHRDLDLIVVGALPYALLVREANPAMPMVIATCPGMVSNGFAKSLEHPGGIATGIDELPPDVTVKRLTLLKQAAPQVSHVALLSTTPGKGGHEVQLADAERTAAALGIRVYPYRASSLGELETALAAIARDDRNGLVNFQGGLSLANRQLIVDFASDHRIPAMYQATLFAESGGLMAWAPDLPNQHRIAARYVDKIMRGAKPGDLSIVYPPRYYLTINASAARALGLTLSPELLAHADRVLP